MSTSSSIPVLSDVLFYTPNDPYNFQTDNRPIYNLDTNLRHINSSLVGIGYGEHVSVSGSPLEAGRAVELLTNGTVRYPVMSTASNSAINPAIGIVIGHTEAGLNRIIWASEHLDLDAIGLTNVISMNSGTTYPSPSALLVTTCSDVVTLAGVVKVVLTPAADQIIIGSIKSFPVVTIGSTSISSNSSNTLGGKQASLNHHNSYGFTRQRNLLAMLDVGQTPLQYTKTTFYQSDLIDINPMSAALSSNKDAIIASNSGTIDYNTTEFRSKVIKEVYTTLYTTVNNSTWVETSFRANIEDGLTSLPNFELESFQQSGDYTASSIKLELFKSYTIEKYYQYLKIPKSNPILHGKLGVTATVFNPDNISNAGGEPGRIIVWDFYEYTTDTGLEKSMTRIVSTGANATSMFINTSNNIFPEALRALRS